MSSRFLQYESEANQQGATESTLKQIDLKLAAPLNVVIDPILTEVSSNVTKINNNIIDIGAGVANIGTQRIILASDQNELKSNITQINGNTIDTNNGISGVGTQRINIANDNDPIPINNKQINNVTIDVGNGDTSALGTQRVVLANDQRTFNWEPISIRKLTYFDSNLYHVSSNCTVTGANNSHATITPIPKDFIDSTATNLNINSIFWLPTVDSSAYIVSESILDTNAAGTGARIVVVFYYNSGSILTSVNINLNGITPVLISNTFFRLQKIIILSTGSDGCNRGDISIVDAPVPTKVYPGSISPKRNTWQSSHIFLPLISPLSQTTGKISGVFILDYVNYLWENGGGGNEEINIWSNRNSSSVWLNVNKQVLNSTIFYEPKISNVFFDVTTSHWDIVLTLLKPNAAGTTNITWGLGYHLE